MALLDDVTADLDVNEGYRAFVYDDANGKAVVPGTTLIGHPTIGIGFALDTDPLSKSEALSLLRTRVNYAIIWASDKFVWFNTLSDVRQRAVTNMIYNLGCEGFLEFEKVISAFSNNTFVVASYEILNSKAALQDPKRYKWIATMVMSDTYTPPP